MSTTSLTTRLTARRAVLPAAALAAALLLTGCGDDATSAGSESVGANGSTSATTQAAFNDVDVAFVEDMKPHHEQAVEMADIVLSKDPSPKVAALAAKIKAAQTPEIAELEALLAAFGVEDSGAHGGGHSMDSMGSMSGMMSDQDMADLEAASGTEAARLFLEGMIVHHEGALEMAEAELAGGKNADAKDLATRIKAAQQAEITEMKALLAAL